MRTVWELIKRSAIKWNEDDCLTLGAALAYYTVFSLAPILIIVMAVAGALFGQEAARGEIVGQIRGLVGEEGAIAIQSLIESVSRQGAGSRATLIGLLVLLFGSTSAFSQLQSALNKIWEVPPPSRSGLWDLVRARFLSFAAADRLPGVRARGQRTAGAATARGARAARGGEELAVVPGGRGDPGPAGRGAHRRRHLDDRAGGSHAVR